MREDWKNWRKKQHELISRDADVFASQVFYTANPVLLYRCPVIYFFVFSTAELDLGILLMPEIGFPEIIACASFNHAIGSVYNCIGNL